MNGLYQDAMALVRKFGKPDLFVTMTCNPKWEEIVRELLPGQTAQDRPDLVARVFKLKLKELIHEIEMGVFGKIKGFSFSVEFQKRGLPHAHIMIILESKERILAGPDSFVCAEIPNKDNHPILYEYVSAHMIHGPCGNLNRSSPCMKEAICSKDFPKAYQQETICPEEQYVIYRRRDNGAFVEKRLAGGRTFKLDNKWVVPYNPYLLKKYNCHLNVEICSTIQVVKYLYKYIFKGGDRLNVTIGENEPRDEIQDHLDCR
jgi:hypothetical protein